MGSCVSKAPAPIPRRAGGPKVKEQCKAEVEAVPKAEAAGTANAAANDGGKENVIANSGGDKVAPIEDVACGAEGEDIGSASDPDQACRNIFDAPEDKRNIAGFQSRDKRAEWRELLQSAQAELQSHPAREYDAAVVQKVLHGELLPDEQDTDYMEPSRVLRCFLSSTFTDTAAERDLLIDDVYPFLRTFADALSMDFQQPSEMRWGIRAAAAANHETSSICMHEIARCQRESCGINYVLLLGDKYGFRPPPSEIPQHEFESLLSHVTDPADRALLAEWYLLDTVRASPVYVLQSSSRVEPDTWWGGVFPRIQSSLRAAARTLSPHRYSLYVQSVTSEEAHNGLLKLAAEAAAETVVYYKRVITNLSPPHKKYIDMQGGSVDTEAQALLATLRDQTVPAALADPARQMREFQVEAEDPGQGRLIELRTHATANRRYLQELSDDFARRMCASLLAGAKRCKVKPDPVYEEARRHGAMARRRHGAFIDTTETGGTLQRIASHFRAQDSPTHPLVVHGLSGSGKTSLVAAAACRLAQWSPQPCVTVVRFLGSSASSSSGRLLVRSLLMQLHRCGVQHPSNAGKAMPDAEQAGGDDAKFPDDMTKLTPMLAETLASAPPERRVNIILDSLDQLSDENRGRELRWLPASLPPHVRLLVSTLPVEGGCLAALTAKLDAVGHAADSLVEVSRFSAGSSEALLAGLEARHQLKLTAEHREVFVQRCRTTPSPLFLVTLFSEAQAWRSYTPAREIPAAVQSESMPALIGCIFSSLADTHGHVTVSTALGLLTAARFGLSNNETEDLLSLNDAVLKEVFEWWTPPVPRLPPLLWARITSDLHAALVRRDDDALLAAPVVTWYHRQFREAAEARFLAGEAREERSWELAAYFGGHPQAGERKANGHANFNSGGFVNLRKMAELPHALRQSRQHERLARHLCDLEFVEMCCHAGYAQELVRFYQEAMERVAASAEVRSLLGAMQVFFKVRSAWFAERPADVFPEAFNLPDSDPVQQQAQRDFDNHKFTRPFLAWSNKRQESAALGAVSWVSEVRGVWTQSGAWAADGERLLCGYDDGLCRVWNTATGETEEQYSLAEGALQITHVNWGPKDTCVVGGDSGQLYVFGAKYGNQAVAASHATDIHKTSFASAETGNAILLVSTGRNNVVQLFRVEHRLDHDGVAIPTGLTLCVSWDNVNGDAGMPGAPPPEAGAWVDSEVFVKGVVFNPTDRRELLTVSTDSFMRVWRLDDGENPTTATNSFSELLPRACDKCDWAPDGSHCVAVCIYHLQLFRVGPGGRLGSVFSGPQMMSDAQFSADSRWLLVMARLVEHRIDLREVENPGVVLAQIDTQGHQPRWMSLPQDMHAIASGDSSGFVKLFDLTGMDAVLTAARDAVQRNGGAQLAAAASGAGGDGKHFDWVTCVQLSPDGEHMASGGNDHTVRVWSVESGAVVRVCERSELGHDQVVDDLAFSSDGAYVATGGRDDKLCVWEVATGELVIVDETERPKGLCWLPADNRSLLFRSVALSTLQLWDVADQTPLCAVTFGPEDNLNASTRLEHIIVATALVGPANDVICVAVRAEIHKVSISSEGSGEQATFRLEHEEGQVMRGHTEGITMLDASREGGRLLSGSWDESVRVWDVATCACLFAIKGQNGRCKGLLTCRGEFALTSGFSDSILHLWDLTTLDDQAAPEQRARKVGSYTTFDENGQFICLSSNHPSCDQPAEIVCAAGTGGGEVKIFSLLCNPPPPTTDDD